MLQDGVDMRVFAFKSTARAREDVSVAAQKKM